jgi:hypothetical protein
MMQDHICELSVTAWGFDLEDDREKVRDTDVGCFVASP